MAIDEKGRTNYRSTGSFGPDPDDSVILRRSGSENRAGYTGRIGGYAISINNTLVDSEIDDDAVLNRVVIEVRHSTVDIHFTIDGVPAGSIYVTVIGGDADEIAAAIDDNKTGGVPTHGSQTVSVYNETTSQAKDIHYDIAADVPIYISLNISVTSGVFPEDGEAQIRANYVTSFVGYKTAQDIIYNSLAGPVYQVPGLIVNTLTVGTGAAPVGVIDVPMSALQRASIPEDDAETLIVIVQS